MLLVLVPIALLAGVVTALSPCVLPVLPIVLAGSVGGGRRRPFGIVTGLVVAFVSFTLALTKALDSLGLSPTAQRDLGVAVLVAFGVTMIVPRLDHRLARGLAPLARAGSRLPKGGDGFAGGLVLGLGLGLVWAPCAGPLLAGISAANATDRVGARTWVVLLAYAIGAAAPLLVIALGGRSLSRRLAPRADALRIGMGALLVATGAVIFVGADTRLSAWVVRSVPGYTDTLQAAERTGVATHEIASLEGGRRTGPGAAAGAGTEATLAETDADADLPDYGPAPDVRSISAWFNTPGGAPLPLASLRGRVVLVDFWTYSCVNCIRTIPHLRALQAAYGRRGLTILGVHTPEFAFERDRGNVARAIRQLGVTWPVALDPDYATWQAWGNQYWPAEYLVDARGRVRGANFGEGDYDQTEREVRTLLGARASGTAAARVPNVAPGPAEALTPESYLGSARLQRFAASGQLRVGRMARYRAPRALGPDELAYDGRWQVEPERIVAGAGAAIDLSFQARRVFLVLGAPGGRLDGRVLLDGRPLARGLAGPDVLRGGRLRVGEHRLYGLVALPREGRHLLTVRLAPGTQAYAFTFG